MVAGRDAQTLLHLRFVLVEGNQHTFFFLCLGFGAGMKYKRQDIKLKWAQLVTSHLQ